MICMIAPSNVDAVRHQHRHCRNGHHLIHIHCELYLLAKSIKILQKLRTNLLFMKFIYISCSWQIKLPLIIIFEQMAFVSISFRRSRTRTYCHSMSRAVARDAEQKQTILELIQSTLGNGNKKQHYRITNFENFVQKLNVM